MKAPRFWQEDNFTARLLAPIAAQYEKIVQQRLARPPEYVSKLPVICVGNVTLGGSGKTPVVDALAQLLQERGAKPAILLRGYGGKEKGPFWVKEDTAFKRCGDEALLHARVAPTLVSADRVAGAREIEGNGEITHILMDDGLQNPALKKTCSVLVVDGQNPGGNGRLFPAGPLRETLENALCRVQALVILGPDKSDLATRYGFLLSVFKARLAPVNGDEFSGKKLLAFAGIGNPDKFFQSLRDCGGDLRETRAFADHHPYRPSDIRQLVARAQKHGATPVTTRKDWVRLPRDLKARIAVLDVRLEWENETALREFLAEKAV